MNTTTKTTTILTKSILGLYRDGIMTAMKSKPKIKFPAHVEFGRTKPGRGKGKWRLRTRAENGNILMTTSEGYCNKAEMWKAVMASVDAILKEYKVQFPG